MNNIHTFENSLAINVRGMDLDSAWDKICPHTFHKLDLSASIIDADGNVQYSPLKNSKGIFRDDGVELDTVGSEFEMVQPKEILNTFRPLFDSNRVQLQCGGSFRGGSAMFAVCSINDAVADVVPGDKITGDFVLYSGFDGKLSIGAKSVIIRSACSNTLPMELRHMLGNPSRVQRASMRGRSYFTFRHTKNVRLKMEDTVRAISAALNEFENTTEAFRSLARKPMNDRTMQTYVRQVMLTPEQLQGTEEISTRAENKVNRIIELIDTQRGLELVPAIRGTAWQAYNAVTEYLTHESGHNDDSRLNSTWFGANAKIADDALQIALNNY